MRKLVLFGLIAALAATSMSIGSAGAAPSNVTGTWTFSVDLEDGGHGDPTFVLKQEGDKLSGSYSGPMGERQVSGTVKGNQAVFSFEFAHESQAGRATYSGTIDGSSAMHGTVQFKRDGRAGERGQMDGREEVAG